MPFDDRTEWKYTTDISDRFGEQFKGRHIIGRDRRIQGGVDIWGAGPTASAIVVDPAKYPEPYEALYAEVMRRVTINGEPRRDRVLDSVYRIVDERMRYSIPGVDAFERTIAEGPQGGVKIELGAYIREGVGVCRQMALTAGVLLEMLHDRGVIIGTPSIDRNVAWNPDGAVEGGHQWVRYTNSAGAVYILDVAQHHLKSLEESGAARWNYARPEERERLIESTSRQPVVRDDPAPGIAR